MATKKSTPKPAAAEKPHRIAKRTAARSKPMAAEGIGQPNGAGPRFQRGSVDQRLQTIETVLNRVLAKLATHGMAISDEPEEEDNETDETEPAEG